MKEPTMPTSEDIKGKNESGQEDIEEIFKRLRKMDSEKGESITKEDVKWFKSLDFEDIFSSFKKSLEVGEGSWAIMEEEDAGELDARGYLYRRVIDKVEMWEKNNPE